MSEKTNNETIAEMNRPYIAALITIGVLMFVGLIVFLYFVNPGPNRVTPELARAAVEVQSDRFEASGEYANGIEMVRMARKWSDQLRRTPHWSIQVNPNGDKLTMQVNDELGYWITIKMRRGELVRSTCVYRHKVGYRFFHREITEIVECPDLTKQPKRSFETTD